MIFENGQSSSVIQIYPGLSLVAIATKFGTKCVITGLLLEISARSLRLMGGLRNGLLNEGNLIPPQPQPLLPFECHVTLKKSRL